jgi:hypothetical protein
VHNLKKRDSEITALKNELENSAESKEQLSAAETTVREQAIEIATLEAQAEQATEGRSNDTDGEGPMTGSSNDTPANKEGFTCPPGLRTPSASDFLRRLEAEKTCKQLATQCATLCKTLKSLQLSVSELAEAYDNALQSEDWTEFEKLFGEVQGEAEQGKTTDSHTVYNEAVARAHDLVVDLRQIGRKELSARNDKNRILNLIEQHAKSCKGPKIFGSHTQYPDFLPQKDATLRGGR